MKRDDDPFPLLIPVHVSEKKKYFYTPYNLIFYSSLSLCVYYFRNRGQCDCDAENVCVKYNTMCVVSTFAGDLKTLFSRKTHLSLHNLSLGRFICIGC